MKIRVVALACLLVTACSPKASVDALPDAKALAQTFFDEYKRENYEPIFALYGQKFWEAMPKETWGKILPNVVEELGAIESCELASWNQSTQMNTSGSGNFVHLVYACKHTKYDSVISFSVFKPLGGGPSKIMGQNFSSLGLLLE